VQTGSKSKPTAHFCANAKHHFISAAKIDFMGLVEKHVPTR
jgi:hypothetical protein